MSAAPDSVQSVIVRQSGWALVAIYWQFMYFCKGAGTPHTRRRGTSTPQLWGYPTYPFTLWERPEFDMVTYMGIGVLFQNLSTAFWVIVLTDKDSKAKNDVLRGAKYTAKYRGVPLHADVSASASRDLPSTAAAATPKRHQQHQSVRNCGMLWSRMRQRGWPRSIDGELR